MLIVFTSEDVCGTNIAMQLIKEFDFRQEPALETTDGKKFRAWSRKKVKLIEVATRLSRDSEYLGDYKCFESNLVVFVSRHRSETGKPCFTVHASGNWTANEEFGPPEELGFASALAIKSVMKFFNENPLQGFQASLEATHHGPTSLLSPSLFVEVGSTEKEWRNQEAALVAARAAMHACENYGGESNARIALGFGGGHYTPSFTRRVLGNYATSHIASKNVLDYVDAALVKQAIAKTVEKVDLALIDWKGCSGEQRKKVIEILEEIGLPYEKT